MDFLWHVPQNFVFLWQRNLIFLKPAQVTETRSVNFPMRTKQSENVLEQIKGKFYVFWDVWTASAELRESWERESRKVEGMKEENERNHVGETRSQKEKLSKFKWKESFSAPNLFAGGFHIIHFYFLA